MSSIHTPQTDIGQKPSDHGTTTSYVIGFILSLVFTFIPYHLVTEHILSGNTLIATILGFGVLQLIVQLVFFLHLGREKKPRWQLFFLIGTIGIILVVVGGSIFIMNNLHYSMAPADTSKKVAGNEGIYQIEGKETGACPGGTGTTHKVELKNNTIIPAHTEARVCDTLMIINLEDSTRTINFGEFEEHKPYAGELGKTIRPSRNTVLPLTEQGTHLFHDHLQPQVSGTFTVNQ